MVLYGVSHAMLNAPAAGAVEQYLLIERGDVNSWASTTIWSHLPTTRPGWVRSGFVRPFTDLSPSGFTLGHNGERNFHCPNFYDTYLKDEEDRALWLAMRSQITFARNIIGPPGMPAELAQALRDALTAAMADRRVRRRLGGRCRSQEHVHRRRNRSAARYRCGQQLPSEPRRDRADPRGRIRQVRPLGLTARSARVPIESWRKPSLGPVLTPFQTPA